MLNSSDEFNASVNEQPRSTAGSKARAGRHCEDARRVSFVVKRIEKKCRSLLTDRRIRHRYKYILQSDNTTLTATCFG